eukprot:1894301-Rhodomonas_salina.2
MSGTDLAHCGNQGTKEDKTLFQGAQKLLGILITIAESVAYVLSGIISAVSRRACSTMRRTDIVHDVPRHVRRHQGFGCG